MDNNQFKLLIQDILHKASEAVDAGENYPQEYFDYFEWYNDLRDILIKWAINNNTDPNVSDDEIEIAIDDEASNIIIDVARRYATNNMQLTKNQNQQQNKESKQ